MGTTFHNGHDWDEGLIDNISDDNSTAIHSFLVLELLPLIVCVDA
jgi:hypothetical protein